LVATFALAYSIPSSRHLLLFPRHLADPAFLEQLRTRSRWRPAYPGYVLLSSCVGP